MNTRPRSFTSQLIVWTLLAIATAKLAGFAYTQATAPVPSPLRADPAHPDPPPFTATPAHPSRTWTTRTGAEIEGPSYLRSEQIGGVRHAILATGSGSFPLAYTNLSPLDCAYILTVDPHAQLVNFATDAELDAILASQ